MLRLFEEYTKNGKITEALLAGRNLFNRNPGDEKIFSAYFSYLCTLAETLPAFADRKNFAEQANVALAFYSENAMLTKEFVEGFSIYQQRLNVILENIKKTTMERMAEEQEKAESLNTESLKKLFALKDSMQGKITQEKFDEILVQIGKLDDVIEKDAFTEEQASLYESLKKAVSELIGVKMRQLEHGKNIDYNKQAAQAFASAFEKFRKEEGKYKNQAQLFSLVSTTLFAFDASRLFNETLIYYNHVYSYIFSRLDDDGKLALTRYAIECERKQR